MAAGFGDEGDPRRDGVAHQPTLGPNRGRDLYEGAVMTRRPLREGGE
jgi:hypothetical protein